MHKASWGMYPRLYAQPSLHYTQRTVQRTHYTRLPMLSTTTPCTLCVWTVISSVSRVCSSQMEE